MKYQVIVGNIGTVYEGHLMKAALQFYSDYKQLSQMGYGRAANEPVTLLVDGEIVREHSPVSS